MSTDRTLLAKSDILRGLRRLDALARGESLTIDLSIYGGAALAIAFDMRPSTRDVDAVVRSGAGNAKVRELAARVANEEGWPDDWLNDGVKGFLSGNEALAPVEIPGMPVHQDGGLRVQLPTAEYLFAMKCMAMRSGPDTPHDLDDIEGLARHLGLQTAEEALSIIKGFYPEDRIPPKVRFGVEELIERFASGEAAPTKTSDGSTRRE